jgi:hypothetical protein
MKSQSRSGKGWGGTHRRVGFWATSPITFILLYPTADLPILAATIYCASSSTFHFLLTAYSAHSDQILRSHTPSCAGRSPLPPVRPANAPGWQGRGHQSKQLLPNQPMDLHCSCAPDEFVHHCHVPPSGDEQSTFRSTVTHSPTQHAPRCIPRVVRPPASATDRGPGFSTKKTTHTTINVVKRALVVIFSQRVFWKRVRRKKKKRVGRNP